MGCGITYSDYEPEYHYDRNHPAVDSDGYTEEWFIRAIEDSEPYEYYD